MTGRRRWQAFHYGPGIGLAVVGAAGFVATGHLWTISLALAGVAMILQVRSFVYLYRSAYFRGRGEQLRDLSRGTWPDPSKMDPQPWDSLRVGE